MKKTDKKMDKRRAYIRDWDKEKRFPVSIRLRRGEDAELIEIFKNIPNKAEWLRGCLLAEKEKAV